MYSLVSVQTLIHMENGEEVSRETTEQEVASCTVEQLVAWMQSGKLPAGTVTA